MFVENTSHKRTKTVARVDTGGIGSLLANRTNLVVFAGIALYGAGYGVFITIIPAFLINTKDVAQTIVGVFFGFFYLALGISQLFAGAWSDRNGRKPVMVAGLLSASLGIVIFHKCPYPFYLVFLALASLGFGLFCVSSMAYLNDRVPESLKGTVSGAFYFFWGAGYFSGPLLVGSIGSAIDFRAGFLFLSGLIAAQLFAVHYFVKGDSERNEAVGQM